MKKILLYLVILELRRKSHNRHETRNLWDMESLDPPAKERELVRP